MVAVHDSQPTEILDCARSFLVARARSPPAPRSRIKWIKSRLITLQPTWNRIFKRGLKNGLSRRGMTNPRINDPLPPPSGSPRLLCHLKHGLRRKQKSGKIRQRKRSESVPWYHGQMVRMERDNVSFVEDEESLCRLEAST